MSLHSMLAEAKKQVIMGQGLLGQIYGRYKIRINKNLNTHCPNKRCADDTLFIRIFDITALEPRQCVEELRDEIPYLEHSNPSDGCIEIGLEVVNKSTKEECLVDKICTIYLLPVYNSEGGFIGFEMLDFCHS